MKSFLVTICKTAAFFVGWLLLATLIPIPDFDNGAVWRFCAELIAILCIIGMTAIFMKIDKNNNIKLYFISNVMNNVSVGVVTGIVWIG